jgi:hypothetical protein
VRYFRGFVLNLFSDCWGEPLGWHNFFGHTCSVETNFMIARNTRQKYDGGLLIFPALFVLTSFDAFSTTRGAVICARTPHLHDMVHQLCAKSGLSPLGFQPANCRPLERHKGSAITAVVSGPPAFSGQLVHLLCLLSSTLGDSEQFQTKPPPLTIRRSPIIAKPC